MLHLYKARDVNLSWLASFMGALIGTLSHILLDAIMHFDMNPLWPFAQGNALLSIISLAELHLLCLGLGLLGLAGLGLRKIRPEG